MSANAKTRNWQTRFLGFHGLPYPTARADGTLVLSPDYVPRISSIRTAEEVNGIAFRDMPAPEHMPYFFNVLDAIDKKSRRVFMAISEPGIGKSVTADVISNMMIGKSALCYECGNKNVGDLLFTTALTERPEQTLYDWVLKKVMDGRAHELSIKKLNDTLGDAFNRETGAVDWEKVVSQNKAVTTIYETFRDIAHAEGINMQSGIALREELGIITEGYLKDCPVLGDEYTDGKPDSFKSLNATIEWLARRTSAITVKSNSGLEHTLGNLDAKPGFFVFLTGNDVGDAHSTSALPQSQHSRLMPVYLPSLGELGLTHRFCQMMVRLPLSTLDKLYGSYFENSKSEEFTSFCKELRTLGLPSSEIERIPAHQIALLERPRQVIEVAKKFAELFKRWRNKVNLNNANLTPDLMAELTEDYVTANTPDPRLFDNLFRSALERAERCAMKDMTIAPNAVFKPLSNEDLEPTIATDRIGSALAEVLYEEINNKTPNHPNLRNILISDAVELGLLPSRQTGNVKTLAQLLDKSDAIEVPVAQDSDTQGDNPSSSAATVTTSFAASNLEIGKLIAGKGIYMGQWEPTDRSGKSLGKKFNVFAAPEDLTDSAGQKMILQFNAVAVEVAKLRNWHGHDGVDCANDTAVYKGLEDGSAVGRWFIPPREIIDGKILDGKGKWVKTRAENLYDLRNEGDFDGTFTTVNSGTGNALWYWSSTEHRDDSDDVWNVDFSDGDDDCFRKDDHRLSCRPCRVELVI